LLSRTSEKREKAVGTIMSRLAAGREALAKLK
jgi:hypothetical protein